jgi:hypothetical protein
MRWAVFFVAVIALYGLSRGGIVGAIGGGAFAVIAVVLIASTERRGSRP